MFWFNRLYPYFSDCFAGRPIVELVSKIKIKGKNFLKPLELVALTTFLITEHYY